jgi:hypothetical protein
VAWKSLGLEDVSSTADSERVKGPSLLFAVVTAVGSSFYALFCLVAISFAGDRRPTTVVPYLYVAAVLAATFLAWRAVRFISRDEPDSARSGLVKYAVVAGIFLVIGLHSSVHSDGKVLAFGLVIEACAFSAYALMPD